MDVSSIAATAVGMRSDMTRQDMAISLLKLAAAQQDQLAAMLTQSVQQAMPQSDKSFNFSIYA